MWFIVLVLILVLFFQAKKVRDLGDEVVKLRYLEKSLPEMREELENALQVTRRHLVQVADGEAPARETILEGRPYTDLAPEEAKHLYNENNDLTVLDVRTPQEYEAGHIEKAVNIPINSLESQLNELPNKETPLLVYCASGARSLAACELLSQKGYTKIFHLPSGYASFPTK